MELTHLTMVAVFAHAVPVPAHASCPTPQRGHFTARGTEPTSGQWLCGLPCTPSPSLGP